MGDGASADLQRERANKARDHLEKCYIQDKEKVTYTRKIFLEGSTVPEKYFMVVIFKGDSSCQLPKKAVVTGSAFSEEGVEEFAIEVHMDSKGKEVNRKSEPLRTFEIFMRDLSETDKSKFYALPQSKDAKKIDSDVARR